MNELDLLSDLIKKSYDLAVKYHDGQFRRDGVTPYISHVFKVEENAARLCAELYPNDLIFHRKVRIVSYCHDLLEDTNVTKELLRELGFTEELIEAIQLLTHKENQSYMEMIKEIDKNLLAWIVKIADNLANLSDTPTFKQIRKYSKSLQYLTCPLE